MNRFSRTSGAVCLTLLALQTRPLAANVLDTYGQGARTIAVGNATTAGGSTAFAAYTNPALLTQTQKNEISAQLLLTQFSLQDLPEAPGSQLPRDQDRASQAEDLQGTSVGMSFILAEGLHLGFAAFMPQNSFGRIKGVSPYQASYLRYSENQGKPSIYSALAVKLPYGLSFGAGAYYSLKAKGVLQISLTSTESEGRVDLNMEPVIAPYAGLSWENEALTLGLTYREAQKTDSRIDSAFALSTDDFTLPFNANTSLVPFYDPALWRFGVNYDFGPAELLFSFEQAQWGRYKTPLVALSGNDVASISGEANLLNAQLQDTQAYRLGTIVPFQAWNQNLEARAGLEFHTSANKVGSPSTVVDPARTTGALGAVWKLPADSKDRRLTVEAAYQYTSLDAMDRTTPKGAKIHLGSSNAIQTFVGGLGYEL